MTRTSPEHAEDDPPVTQPGKGLRLAGDGAEPTSGTASGATSGGEDFDAVVAEHESAMLRYARHQLGRDYEGRHQDAQDIVQEALLRLHRHRRDAGALKIKNTRAWLMRVTHNLSIDAIRKRTRQRALKLKMQQEAVISEQQAGPEPTGPEALEAQEATQHVMRLLHELPDTQQRVLMLRLNYLTVRQIAEVLNMSVGNVGYHLNQGLSTLARQLKQAGVV